MATTKLLTDKIKGLPTVTDLTGHTLLTSDPDGSLGRLNAALLLDGVLIMYHRKSDNFPLMVKPHKWTSLQNAGEIADGVVVVEGGKVLVVAPTESQGLPWGSNGENASATNTYDIVDAMNDWNGKANTASIISNSTPEAVTDTSAYAPGFCNLYSRGGLAAGKWWLPSEGELMMIYANMAKINCALRLISGAMELTEKTYWSSTENGRPFAWGITISSGNIGISPNRFSKTVGRFTARPVSTFIL